jgi:glycosyltransferase involved in cell wall biosynthesis
VSKVVGVPQVLFDVTQYVSWPARSGVQRVMARLVASWQGISVQPYFGYIEDGRYVTGPLAAFASLIGETFAERAQLPTPVAARAVLRAAADTETSAAELEKRFDAYLLPEPSLQQQTLQIASGLLRRGRIPVFFLYHDSFPLTHPWFFPPRADLDVIVTRYHQAVSRARHVAFISTVTRELFERRLVRGRVPDALVATLGADGLPHLSATAGDVPTFVLLGTVEPRKGHRVVLEAFERLWAAGHDRRLTIVGAAGREDPAFIARVEELARSRRVEWLSEVTDQELAAAIGGSWAAIFTPSAGGYGLPALEALALGTPAIAPADLPSLVGLPGDGQLRLSELTPETIAGAVQELSDPATSRAYRAAAAALSLPTWEGFARTVEDWVSRTVVDSFLRESEA